MSLYTIGDLHLSLGTNKPMDIFGGWDNYIDKLEANWNQLVCDDDVVVIVGDTSWAMYLTELDSDFSFINSTLKGNKIIIKGNHDYWWSTMAKMNDYLDEKGFGKIKILHNNSYAYENINICGTRGWVNETGKAPDLKILERESGRLLMSINHAKKQNQDEIIAFIHYPPIFAGDENYLITDVLEKNGIKRCFYGHIHGYGHKKMFEGEKYGIKFTAVPADYVNFTPQLVIS